MATQALAHEKVWVGKISYDRAECAHFERLAKVMSHNIVELYPSKPKSLVSTNQQDIITTNQQIKSSSKKSKEKKNKADKKNKYSKDVKNEDAGQKELIVLQESRVSACSVTPASGSLANEIAKARQHIKKGLQCVNNIAADVSGNLQDWPGRVAALEKDNCELRKTVAELRALLDKLTLKENQKDPEPYIAICPAKPQDSKAQDGDDDVDLFGSDSEGEDEEAAKIREERLAAYNAKKSKKPTLIAKSNIILDVKPWDDETDMKALEAEVRKVTTDGLLWGAAKLVPLAYGIHKLQISCVVEDDKVSVDWLTEAIQEIEEYVQSVDIAAFNKV